MKLTQVSLLLALLTACVEDPLAPVPPLPRALIDDGEVVITGRIINSESNLGIQAANLRVIDAKASVGTDETGRYRIVLPGKYRGQTVPVNIRAIGFKVQSRTVSFDRDDVTLDVAMTVEALRFDCAIVMGVVYAAVTQEPGFTVTTRPARIIWQGARVAK